MTNERFFEMMTEIDDRLLLREAGAVKKSAKKAHWLRWSAPAACLTLVVTLGLAWFGDHTVTLDSGDTLRFERGGSVGSGNIDLDGLFGCDVEFRILTQEEAAVLVDDFKFAGWGLYNVETGVLLGFEGKIDEEIHLQVSSGPIWSCAVIKGEEQTSVVNGVPVTAGYTVTDANSKGERNIIYYATLEIGDQTMYVEHSGLLKDREVVREELADVIETLIDNKEIDLTKIQL